VVGRKDGQRGRGADKPSRGGPSNGDRGQMSNGPREKRYHEMGGHGSQNQRGLSREEVWVLLAQKKRVG